jgi:hypothetical protein
MNKLGYQPLPVLFRAEPSDARWTSNSAKILGAVAALCGAVAIFLIGLSAFPPRALESKAPVDVTILPVTKVSPTVAANQDNGMVMQTPDTNQVHRGTIAEDHSIVNQTPTSALNPTSTPAPAPKPEASVSDNEFLKGERPEAGRINLDRQLPGAMRKNLEEERREAERKRSRLEEVYRKHAISSESYKKGEEKYRSEIERYRREMNASTGSKNEAEQGKIDAISGTGH